MKILAFVLCALTLTATPMRAADLLVFAAASLKEPLDQLALTMPGVVVSYGGSGTLARQVMAGAPADLVVLAHPDWMQAMDESGDLVPGSRVDVLSNTLVLVAPSGHADVSLTPEGLVAALGDGRIAMGLTNSVPAGIYGREALTSLGLWDNLADRLAEVDSVRAALALVARGEAPLGIVYGSDARVEPLVRVVATFPEDSHVPILYQAAAVAGGNPKALTFLDLLTSAEGQTAFAAAGFVPLMPQ